MIIGVPKEIKAQENRVGLLPSAAYQLVKRGHRVVVETQAGAGSGFPDEEYAHAGAEILLTHEAIFAQAEMIVKVKEPLPQEYPLLRPGQILFTYLHLAASKSLTEALLASRCTGIAYETVEVNRRLPLLEPMSEIAGRMSVVVGAYFLAKHEGGKGVLLGGVPGVLPGKVVVIGGGTAGVNAARMATGLARTSPSWRWMWSACASSTSLCTPPIRCTPTTPISWKCCPAWTCSSEPCWCPGPSAQAHYPPDATGHEAGQCACGHRDRPGRLL